MGLTKESRFIYKIIPNPRPNIGFFRDHFSNQRILSFLIHTALNSVATKTNLRERDIFPNELMELGVEERASFSDLEFRAKLQEKLNEKVKAAKEGAKKDSKVLSYEEKNEIERYLKERAGKAFALIQSFVKLLASPLNSADQDFLGLLSSWEEAIKGYDSYSGAEYNRFFQQLGLEILVFALSVRNDLKEASIKKFLQTIYKQKAQSVGICMEIVDILAKRKDFHSLAGEEAVRVHKLIESEDEVIRRASLFAQLGRSIAPASKDEAAAYFRTGLEQMDAIGSGDHQFTNELLIFASSLKGNELSEKDFHVLTNICELNMASEETKFPWFAFAKGLSKAAGVEVSLN